MKDKVAGGELKSAVPEQDCPVDNKPPERWISVFGFVIVTKADLLAAAAFLLSLVSVIYQLSVWVKGPSPSLYSPEIVYVFFDKYPNNQTIVRFVSQISAVNTAEIGHDSVVRSVSLKILGKDIEINQTWLNFVTIQRNGTNLVISPKEAAHPFPIPAGSAASNSVSFAPVEQACQQIAEQPSSSSSCSPTRYYINEIEFQNKIAKVDALNLTFEASIVGSSKPLVATCTLPIGEAFRQYIAENGWFAGTCQPTK